MQNKCKSIVLTNRSKNNFDWQSDNTSLQNKQLKFSVDTIIQDEIKHCLQEYQDYIVIPLPDLIDNGGAWRVWSCILLAHLIKDEMNLVIEEPNLAPAIANPSQSRANNTNFYGKLFKRGKYQTRCPKKYFWQRSLSDEDMDDSEILSNKFLHFRPILNTVS